MLYEYVPFFVLDQHAETALEGANLEAYSLQEDMSPYSDTIFRLRANLSLL